MKIILKEIIKNKSKEVAQKKQKRDFLGAIMNPKVGDVSVIAEIKLASPSEGKLGDTADIGKKVKDYEKGFADAISVVVDKKYFGGELELIRQIKDAVSIPVLAKDFIIDPYQIYEMKVYGADAVLLIARIILPSQLKEFVELSLEIGLEPVVEIQNTEELKNALKTDTRIIAVNARDLSTFKIDIDRACKLLKLIPQKFVILGFSGVSSRDEVAKYKKAGAKGVLVGTSSMKEKRVGKFIAQLKGVQNLDYKS